MKTKVLLNLFVAVLFAAMFALTLLITESLKLSENNIPLLLITGIGMRYFIQEFIDGKECKIFRVTGFSCAIVFSTILASLGLFSVGILWILGAVCLILLIVTIALYYHGK